jgi:hypothetical protein
MMYGKSLGRGLGALVLIVALFASPAAAQSESSGAEGAWGAGAALVSLVYAPTKLVYAIGGSLVAGLAWVCSGGDRATMQPILDASLRGDYVVTPAQLRGELPIEFVGRSAENRALRSGDVAGAPPPIESEEIYRDGF